MVRLVSRSTIDLVSGTSGADVRIIRTFQEPSSRFFVALANAQPVRGGKFKVHATLFWNGWNRLKEF